MKTETFSPATLKSLSVRECVGLARFLYPDLKWQYRTPYPDDEWDGHDVVSGKPISVTTYPATLSIDYRDDITTEQPRIIFKLLNGRQEVPDQSLVISYLTSIGKL